MSKLKKILLIVLFIGVIIVVSILLYRTFFKKTSVSVIPSPQTGSNGKLPTINEGNVPVKPNPSNNNNLSNAEDIFIQKTQINDVARGSFTNSKELVSKNVKSPSFSSANDALVYYDRGNQSFYKVKSDGSLAKISDNKFHSVTNVVWSPVRNQALIEYPEDNNVPYNKVLYDFNQDKAITSFQKEMKDFGFSSNGEDLSAKWVGDYEDHNYVVSCDIHGNNFKFVEPMGDQARNVQTVWSPDAEVLATYRKTVDANRQEVFFINENGKNLKSLIVDGRGFKGRWNPKGDKILYSVFKPKSNYNPTLWIANGQADGLGSGKRYVGLDTWVDKCDFSKSDSEMVYCAVPDYLPTGSGWYPELADKVPYQIYKVDLNTGRKEKVAIPVANGTRVAIDKIYLGNNDKVLYYTNKANGHLYSIDLATN